MANIFLFLDVISGTAPRRMPLFIIDLAGVLGRRIKGYGTRMTQMQATLICTGLFAQASIFTDSSGAIWDAGPSPARDNHR